MIRSIYVDDVQKINKRKNFERKLMRREVEMLNNKLEIEKDNQIREELSIKLDRLQGKLRIEQDKIAKEIAEKIKTKWYNEGEKSTKYFLNQLKSRSKKQKITSLTENNQEFSNPTDIENIVFNFYKNLYSKEKTEIDSEKEDKLISLIDKLEEEQITSIESKIENHELIAVLRKTNDSAPGPDGITYSFLKYLWPIYGKILIDSWNYGIMTGKMAPSHNSSTLTLLPEEGKNLQELKNWRPEKKKKKKLETNHTFEL